jgi:hypothetical protein
LGNRILCIGTDIGLLVTRRLLLLSRGYDPAIAFPRDVNKEMLCEGFNLVILSVTVEEKDRLRILDIVPTWTRTLVLTNFADPDELLTMVEQALA